jgi:hypothetical protein
MALTLGACGPSGTAPQSGSIKIALPPAPGDLQACFSRLVPAPEGSTLTRQQIVRLVADLKQSERAKSLCGRRLLAWYASEAGGLR